METKLTVSEINEVFARFMGLDWNSYERLKRNYESDWRELMPVVEKIESLGYDSYIEFLKGYTSLYDNITHDDVHCAYFEDQQGVRIDKVAKSPVKIEAVYNACYSFITWYNNQNSK
jgi:hypothetical protein